jgi:hypothetical protein
MKKKSRGTQNTHKIKAQSHHFSSLPFQTDLIGSIAVFLINSFGQFHYPRMDSGDHRLHGVGLLPVHLPASGCLCNCAQHQLHLLQFVLDSSFFISS